MDLQIREEHAAGSITLSRPGANALTPAMLRAIAEPIPGWVRAPMIYCFVVESALPGIFSAGLDLDGLCNLARGNPAEADAALATAYTLAWQLDCFTKPEICFMDGPADGGGFALAAYGTHQVASERFSVSAPGVRTGWFPDFGLAYLFARMPSCLGQYLALTGTSVGPADAFRLKLVTHVIPQARHAAIKAALSDADPVDPLLDDIHMDPGPAPLEAREEAIARCFSASGVVEILARLDAETGKHGDWARETAAILRANSPLSLAITHRAVQAAAGLDLRETLLQDYRIAVRRLRDPDVGNAPRADAATWTPSSLAAIDEASLARYFASLGPAELPLLSRAQMQAVGP